MSPPDNDKLLLVEGLVTEFGAGDAAIRPVDGVSLSVGRGEAVAIVGESGCGKSLTALSIMRLVPPPGRIAAGEIVFEGRDLPALPERRMRGVRGGRMAMIFQEPGGSLNPVLTAGQQITEAIELHRGLRGKAAREPAVELLARVGIPEPRRRFASYPHELSGGMAQRAMIAMALAGEPALLIADEPTTALDVTIQAQVLALLSDLRTNAGMSLLLITHDLGVVAQAAQRVYVMYAGRIVEMAPTAALLAEPLHPYTEALLRCVPSLARKATRLEAIPGAVPSPTAYPGGCRFHPRCELGRDVARCRSEGQRLSEVRPGRRVACWKREADPAGG